MQATSLSASERQIIADIHAFCRRRGWPTNVRPSFQAYLDGGGQFDEKQIGALGGWRKLCALGGMQTRTAIMDALRLSKRPTPPLDFDAIVADVRRVAQELRIKPGARLTRAVYERSGGLYNFAAISRFGGWTTVSAAAGVPSRIGQRGQPRHPWQKTKPVAGVCEIDAALDRLVGRDTVSRGILLKRGRLRAALHRDVPVLERGEIIADIRQIALSLGLLSPRLLTFETYRNHGGRYSLDQASTLGGFDTLRRAA